MTGTGASPKRETVVEYAAHPTKRVLPLRKEWLLLEAILHVAAVLCLATPLLAQTEPQLFAIGIVVSIIATILQFLRSRSQPPGILRLVVVLLCYLMMSLGIFVTGDESMDIAIIAMAGYAGLTLVEFISVFSVGHLLVIATRIPPERKAEAGESSG